MKVAVLADIHGNAFALERVLDDMQKEDISKMILLGDLVMKGPMPFECLNLLEQCKIDILANIKGNTEDWLFEIAADFEPLTLHEKELFLYYQYAISHLSESQICFLKNLPHTQELVLEGRTILCNHGTPKSNVEAFDEHTYFEKIESAIKDVTQDLILGAHSHTYFYQKVKEQHIFNPGSVGSSLEEDKMASYGVIDFQADGIEFFQRKVDYEREKIMQVAKDSHFPLREAYQKQITPSVFTKNHL